MHKKYLFIQAYSVSAIKCEYCITITILLLQISGKHKNFRSKTITSVRKKYLKYHIYIYKLRV